MDERDDILLGPMPVLGLADARLSIAGCWSTWCQILLWATPYIKAYDHLLPNDTPPLSPVSRVELHMLTECSWRENDRGGIPVALHGLEPGRAWMRPGEVDTVNLHSGTHFHLKYDPIPSLLICHNPQDPSHVLEVLQVVRGLLLGALTSAGVVPIHGAVCIINDVGVLLVGEKGAGKTSFLLSALRSFPKSTFVTNDKAIVLREESLTLFGLPYAVGIGKGTLEAVPELRGHDERWEADKLMLWPYALGERLSCALSETTRVRQVWICSLDLRADDITITPIADQQEQPATVSISAFSDVMNPTWLLRILHWPEPQLPAITGDSITWFRVAGNPWRGKWRFL